jgi:hypothetical protein
MRIYILYTIIILCVGGIYATFQEQPHVAYTDETAKDGLAKESSTNEGNECKDSTKCKKALKQAVKYLKKSSTILKQERKRWKRIHGKVTDRVKVTRDRKKQKLYVEIELDPDVKNEVNDQPITRKYTLDYSPTSMHVFTYLDIMVGAAYAWNSGYRPLLGVGVRPFEFMKERNDGLAGIGIGVHTMVYNSGIILYYSHPAMAPMFFGISVGWDWEGHTVPGVTIGLRI